MKRYSGILGLLLVVVATRDAGAACQILSLAETTDYVTVVPATGRSFEYEMKGSDIVPESLHRMELRYPGTGTGVLGAFGGGCIGDTCTLTAFCVMPGTYDLFVYAGCASGGFEERTISVTIPEVHATLAITDVEHLGGDQYRIHSVSTLPVGLRPGPVAWGVYHLLPDGTYDPNYTLSQTSDIVTAKPGDKVFVGWGTCGGLPVQEQFLATHVIPLPPAVEVAMLDGDGQRAVIGEPTEKPLRVKFTASAPFDFRTLTAVFEMVSIPAGATGYGVGATESSVSQTFSAPVGADGIAEAVLVAGNKAGPYVVRVKSPLTRTGAEARFTTTALQPDTVAILKDSTEMADLAPSYAVSASAVTKFHAVGVDAAGAKIGPMKCTWSVSASGNGSTRGDGTLSPISAARSVLFQPAKAGSMKLAANPVLGRVHNSSAELFITGLYLSVAAFDTANPVDDLPSFVPGSNRDGSSVSLDGMPQRVTLHVLTGGSSRGFVTFQLEDVSAYPGMAMNWPINNPDTAPDLVLENAGQQASSLRVPFSGSGNTSVSLLVRDYAAKGRVRVTIESGKNTYSLASVALPSDANGNTLPDAGWYALQNATTGTSVHITEVSLTSRDDGDDNPTGAGEPTAGRVGDGLTALEEYRGFIVGGYHRRLNPFRKDLLLDMDPELIAYRSMVTKLPLTMHYLRPNEVQATSSADPILDHIRPVINPNRSGITGATTQRALRVRIQTSDLVTAIDPATHTQVPAWRVYGGVCFSDDMDPYDTSNQPPAAEDPNRTSHIDFYPRGFENDVISLGENGLIDSSVDAFGRPVPPCQTASQFDCDIYDTNRGVIAPGPDRILNVVPRPGSDDYYSLFMRFCDPIIAPVVVSRTVVDNVRTAIVAHETVHGLDVDHGGRCGDLMWVHPTLGGVTRFLPTPTDFTNVERDQIRLHKKQ